MSLFFHATVGALTGHSVCYQVDGTVMDDQAGHAVAGAGDLNGDGHSDCVVGIHQFDPAGKGNAGRATALSGINGSGLHDWDGESAQDQMGFDVAVAGDVNNDGFDDVIVGAPEADPGGNFGSGSAYIYSGLNGTELRQFDGFATGENLGLTVAGAGDVNGDNFDDVIVGIPGDNNATGQARVFSGLDGSTLWQFFGSATGDCFGMSVDGGGDVDHDGVPDVIVGAPARDVGLNTDAGSAYVYSGATGALLYQKDGDSTQDFLGQAVALAGDTDNDGYEDFLVGIPREDPVALNEGSASLYSGFSGAQLHRFDGAAAFDLLGFAVAGAGDVNNDGSDDVIVGAYFADPGGLSAAGSAFVYSGATGGLIRRLDGAAAGDQLGFDVRNAGDVDRDGYGDLITGAPGADPGAVSGAGSGIVYCSDATCAPFARPACASSDEVQNLMVSRISGDDLRFSWDPSLHLCHNAYRVYASITPVPGTPPGSFPTDPGFSDITSTGTLNDTQAPDFTATVTAGEQYFLVVDVGLDGVDGAAGHYP